jgi:hypothetical protein
MNIRESNIQYPGFFNYPGSYKRTLCFPVISTLSNVLKLQGGEDNFFNDLNKFLTVLKTSIIHLKQFYAKRKEINRYIL